MLSIKVECSNCKYVFDVNATNIKTKMVNVEEDGKKLELTYYVCPKCNKIHIVQLDDDISKELLTKIKINMKNAVRKRKQKKAYKTATFNAEKEKLILYRGSLNSMYHGKHFYDNGELKEICLMIGK